MSSETYWGITARPVARTSSDDVHRATVVSELGWLPALALVAAAGVLLLALADNAARTSHPSATRLYWIGVAVIFVPIAFRLVRRECARVERVGLVCVLGLSFYLLKVTAWPLGFVFHDDLGQLRTTLDISQTHHLFSTNPIVPAYSYYPGVEIATDAISSLTGISPTFAGFVLIGVARLVLMASLFGLFELASGSARLAGVAALLYAANSNFVYFDAQVAYESLALPLVVLVLYGVARKGDTSRHARGRHLRELGVFAVVAACIAAVVATHHVSAYFLAGALAVWAVLGRRRRFSESPGGSLALAGWSVAVTAAWYAFAGRATAGELGSIPQSAATSVWDLLVGSSPPRQLFHANNGTAEPRADQLIGFASVVLTLVVLPFGVRLVLRKRNAISLVMLLLAILYPATLVLRLTDAGTETSSRASEFVFLGVAYVLAVALVGRPQPPPGSLFAGFRRRVTGSRILGLLAAPSFAAYAFVLFAGGLIIGWSPSVRLPEAYAVGNPPNSISPEGVETATWAGRTLPAHGVVVADGTNALLLAAYGRLDPTGDFLAGRPLLDLYRSPTLGSAGRAMLAETTYLVTDRRLTRALPLNGGYFSADDYALGLRRPLPAAGLRKFDRVRGLSRIYDSGNIAIYRTGRR